MTCDDDSGAKDPKLTRKELARRQRRIACVLPAGVREIG